VATLSLIPGRSRRCQLDVTDPGGPDQLGVRRTDHKVGVSTVGRRGGDRICARRARSPLPWTSRLAPMLASGTTEREARTARLAAGHGGQERGEGLGSMSAALPGQDCKSSQTDPTQPGFVDHRVAHPR